MSTPEPSGIRRWFRYIVFLTVVFSFTGLQAQQVYLCVWRNPERTMTKLFPEAKDYKTVNLDVSKEAAAAIEAEMGFKLLPGQDKSFQYFEMSGKDDERIGTVIAASQKGAYGAIEFVVGIDNAGVINGLYIQRSRERDKTFKKPEFLSLFKGKKIAPAGKFAGLYKGKETKGTTAVVQGLIKEFVAYSQLVDGIDGGD